MGCGKKRKEKSRSARKVSQTHGIRKMETIHIKKRTKEKKKTKKNILWNKSKKKSGFQSIREEE